MRHDDVEFAFLSAGDRPSVQNGIVIEREGEMVLEVECPGERPYTIPGKSIRDFFHGHHEGLPGDEPLEVEAKWIRLDDIYIGTWREQGTEYLFKFTLPA